MIDQNPYPGRFALLYALLAVVFVISIAGAIALALEPQTRAEIHHVEAQLGDQNLTRLADKAIADAASAQGFSVVKIVVLSTKTDPKDPNVAHVDARVTVTDGVNNQTVELVVNFVRGIWSVSGMAAK